MSKMKFPLVISVAAKADGLRTFPVYQTIFFSTIFPMATLNQVAILTDKSLGTVYSNFTATLKILFYRGVAGQPVILIRSNVRNRNSEITILANQSVRRI